LTQGAAHAGRLKHMFKPTAVGYYGRKVFDLFGQKHHVAT